MNHKNVGMQ